MIHATRLGFGALVIVTVAVGGCGGSSPSVGPSVITPKPVPTPPPVIASSTPIPRPFSLFGVVTQVTAAGRVPVEGVLIEEMTCYLEGCGSNVVQSTVTSADGVYRISDLYAGRLNFVWITKAGYEPVGLPAVPTCDYCNKAVALDADTRLDIEVVQR